MKEPIRIAYVAQSLDDGAYFDISNHNGSTELILHPSEKDYQRAGYNPEHWKRVKVELKEIS